MQAAVGCAQLHRLNEFIAARKHNFAYLHSKLKVHSELFELATATDNSDPSWFGFPITLKGEAVNQRTELLKFLNDRKIGTRLLFGGNLIRQPYMAGVEYRVASDLEHTDNIMRNTFWVGVYPGLNDHMLDYIVSSIEAFWIRFMRYYEGGHIGRWARY